MHVKDYLMWKFGSVIQKLLFSIQSVKFDDVFCVKYRIKMVMIVNNSCAYVIGLSQGFGP